MNLKSVLSISLAVTTLLSIFMLGLAGDDENSRYLIFLAIPLIATGIWLVDFQRWFALTEGWFNVLILGVLAIHGVMVMESPGAFFAFLAYSIANILVWVQLILFFRAKDIMTCYQLLILGFVQAGVACVFQQNSFFGLLLLAFSFSVMCTVSLLFLQQERLYYQTHAFLKPAFGAGEKVKRVTVGHLVVLAVRTVVVTPLLLIWGYKWRELTGDVGDDTPHEDFDTSRQSVLRHSTRRFGGEITEDVPNGADPLYGFWERGTDGATFGDAPELVAPVGGVMPPAARWPLLHATPIFAGARLLGAGTMVRKRLLGRLFFGGVMSLMAGGIVFYFFPRPGDMEFGNIRLGHDEWRAGPPAIRSVTGFSETMKLGEMGPLSNNFESVLQLRLVDEGSGEAYRLNPQEPLYLRGTIQVRYENREWFRPEGNATRWRSFSFQADPERNSPFGTAGLAPMPEKEPGFLVPSRLGEMERLIFDHRNDLVREELTLSPMSTRIIFTVWPFFQQGRGFGLLEGERYVRTRGAAARESSVTLYTNAFRNGGQGALTPVQEAVTSTLWDDCLAIDTATLPKLIATAKAWDAESKLPPEKYAERAEYLAAKFRDSGLFAYTRGGVPRDPKLDPLEDFVTQNRAGHCEYFAGALAMILRAVNIPSRVVVGFCVIPTRDETLIVRQSDAHCWVEALVRPESLPAGTFDEKNRQETAWWGEGGWLRLDGTPTRPPELIRSFRINWSAWQEGARRFWSDYVLNYGGARQQQLLYGPLGEIISRGWGRISEFVTALIPFGSRQEKTEEGEFDRKTSDRLPNRWRDFCLGLARFAVGILGVGGLYFFIRWRTIRRRDFGDQTGRMRGGAAGLFARLERQMALFGLTRNESETPREFIRRFAESPPVAEPCGKEIGSMGESSAVLAQRGRENLHAALCEMAPAIVDVYYRVRYGGGTLGSEEKKGFDEAFRAAEIPPPPHRPLIV